MVRGMINCLLHHTQVRMGLVAQLLQKNSVMSPGELYDGKIVFGIGATDARGVERVFQPFIPAPMKGIRGELRLRTDTLQEQRPKWDNEKLARGATTTNRDYTITRRTRLDETILCVKGRHNGVSEAIMVRVNQATLTDHFGTPRAYIQFLRDSRSRTSLTLAPERKRESATDAGTTQPICQRARYTGG